MMTMSASGLANSAAISMRSSTRVEIAPHSLTSWGIRAIASPTWIIPWMILSLPPFSKNPMASFTWMNTCSPSLMQPLTSWPTEPNDPTRIPSIKSSASVIGDWVDGWEISRTQSNTTVNLDIVHIFFRKSLSKENNLTFTF